MKLLLDTHTFLWFASGDKRLPTSTRDFIRLPDNDVSLSVVSVWEVVVKQQLGRLHLPGPAAAYLARQRERHGISALALEESAVFHLAKLPPVHRDPFDRMLICQAIEHDLRLVTNDDAVAEYPVKTIWTIAPASEGEATL